MPQGEDAFERKRQQKEAAKASYGGGDGPKVDYFQLKAQQYAIVRFLEDGNDLTFADFHRIPLVSKAGGRYFRDMVCLNTNGDGTACPACQSPLPDVQKVVTRGVLNLIWRDGPVYQKDDSGFAQRDGNKNLIVVGRADGVFLWKCSWTVLEAIKEKDRAARGLKTRDWRISRTGSTMNDTQYHIEPADFDSGPQEMTIADLALADRKFDLRVLTTPPTYEEMATVLNRGSMPPGQGPQPTFDRGGGGFQQGGGDGFTPAGMQEQQPQASSSAFSRG